jgi:hypothetical protein
VSVSVLQQLSDAQAALIAALDMHDVDAIDAANAAVAVAVEEVRVAGSWQQRQGLREELIQVLKEAETARGHINMLADRNRRHLEKLVSIAGVPQATAYGRSGKLG